MPYGFIGWFHTIAAFVALLSGSLILGSRKGNTFHKQTGRVYALSMLTVCVTAFLIYRLHNAFGILHFFAILSTVTLILGLYPLYFKGVKNPIVTHLSWMYWSVIGLYAAFAAEVFTRLPMVLNVENSYGIFYALVGISSGLVTFAGSYFFKDKKDDWAERFGQAA